MSYRFMRIVLFFDLPSVSNSEKRAYRHFVKGLLKRGFIRIQESVFAKLSQNQTDVDLALASLKTIVPKDGCIMAITVTEKQFSSRKFLLGEIETDVIRSDEKVIRL